MGSTSGWGGSEQMNEGLRKALADLNLSVETDEKRLKQVLINLLSNALKFTKSAGSIKILIELVQGVSDSKIQKKKIDQIQRELRYAEDSFTDKNESSETETEDAIDDQRNKVHRHFYPEVKRDKLVISVIDSGIGIKKKDRKKLFKLFGSL